MHEMDLGRFPAREIAPVWPVCARTRMTDGYGPCSAQHALGFADGGIPPALIIERTGHGA